MCDDLLHIIVAAADEKHRHFCVLLCVFQHLWKENMRKVYLRVCCEIADFGVSARAVSRLAENIGNNACVFIKCAGNAVCVDVVAKEGNLEFFHICDSPLENAQSAFYRRFTPYVIKA